MRRLHRQLAGLADGSRDSPGLRQRVERSPELEALLADQRRAVEVVRAAQPAASADLRARLAHAQPVVRRPRPNLGLLAAAAGVIALAFVAILPGGGGPTVAQAAQLAARGPTQVAPRVDASHPGSLSESIDGIRYPYWQDAFGFTASGSRSDRLDGRVVMTVYYTSAAGRTTGYTIVSGKALPEPHGARELRRDGTDFLTLRAGGRTLLTWRRAGHTCVLSGSGVSLGTLIALAAWQPAGS